MSFRPMYIAHELDAAWIMDLWFAIHGGDPALTVIAAQAVASLAQYVNGTRQETFIFEQLKAQFAKLGVVVTEHEKEVALPKGLQQQLQAYCDRVYQYCFKFEGSTICTELPVLTHLRTAA